MAIHSFVASNTRLTDSTLYAQLPGMGPPTTFLWDLLGGQLRTATTL